MLDDVLNNAQEGHLEKKSSVKIRGLHERYWSVIKSFSQEISALYAEKSDKQCNENMSIV